MSADKLLTAEGFIKCIKTQCDPGYVHSYIITQVSEFIHIMIYHHLRLSLVEDCLQMFVILPNSSLLLIYVDTAKPVYTELEISYVCIIIIIYYYFLLLLLLLLLLLGLLLLLL